MHDTAPLDAEAPAVACGDFIVIAGHGRVITHRLDRPVLTIGRDAGCDVAIDHPALSRRHAVLRLGPPVTIQDLGSTNGVRVSRRTVRGGAAVALEPGETFHVGGFSFNVVGPDGLPAGSNRSGLERLRVDDPTAAGVAGFVRDVAATATSVLILGESGVGKEVLAETLHALSGRAGALARVNCAALAEPLVESELFGHEKGAFTGAAGSKIGLLESAEGGTVFLDEIGELPLGVQAKLLRAIEAREVLRLGAVRPVTIDVRFLAATNRDLPSEVAAKRFRHDLYFRLDGISLVIPPLRDRRDRIGALAAGFLEAAARRVDRAPASLSPEALAALTAYDWPGNVRELKAVIERALLLARGDTLAARHLAFTPRVSASSPAPASPAIVADGEPSHVAHLTPAQRQQRAELIDALARSGGNQTRAARQLRISRTTLVNRVRLFGLVRPRT